MGYNPETWVDDDGSGTVGTVFNAARMNHIEQAINVAMPAGTIVPYAGFTPPSGSAWVLCDGGQYDKDAYANLYNAITLEVSASMTSGSPTVTGLPAGAIQKFGSGAAVVSTNLSASASVLGQPSPTSMTLSRNGLSTTTATLRIMPYGGASAVTAFKVPDLQGRMPMGQDRVGGIINAFGAESKPGVAGGAYSHKHSVSLTTGAPSATVNVGGGAAQTPGSGTHTHSVSGDSAGAVALPPYTTVQYIIKT